MAAIIKFYDSYVCPPVNGAYDLGFLTLRFGKIYISGYAYLTALGENLNINGKDLSKAAYIYGFDNDIFINLSIDGKVTIQADGVVEVNSLLQTQNVQPLTNDTYYVGKNSISTPLAYKGIVLRDTANGNYYRIEVTNGNVVATQIT